MGALKAVVVSLGLLIVAVVGLIGYELFRRADQTALTKAKVSAHKVTIPKDAVAPQQLNAFLDWLRLEEIAQRSRLTETHANRLAEEIKGDWWGANKGKFIPPSEQ